MTIDLTVFCGKGDVRTYLHDPFSIGEYSYATDGHVAIRIPRRDDVPEIENAPDIGKVFAPLVDLAFQPLPSITILAVSLPECRDCDGKGYGEKCSECHGEGNHGCDCEYCGRECDECDGTGIMIADGDLPEDQRLPCETCDGRGTRLDDRDIVFSDELVLAARFIERLLALPGPHEMAIQTHSAFGTPQFFRFNGGIVAIMPRRRSNKRDGEIVVAAKEAAL